MKNILIHAWTIDFDGVNYYLPYTHWIYLKEIKKYYQKVYLLCPTHKILTNSNKNLKSIGSFENVTIINLPASKGYIAAIIYFFNYLVAYKKLKGKVSIVYARYPVPFGWLQKVFFANQQRIIHYVGDPADSIRNNPKINKIKKHILLFLFKPEQKLYLWACNGAKVYTNGDHLAKVLIDQGVNAIPLVSSTLTKNDFYFETNKKIDPNKPKLLYIGFLRKAKGVETLIEAYKLIKNKISGVSFTIVGTGEMEFVLRDKVKSMNLEGVNFLGHIDDREHLNRIMREHDIFCFASLSEGSPRVILEAMASGINVVSTPVGSLPFTFTDSQEILFADYHNESLFYSKIMEVIQDEKKAEDIRYTSYEMVKKFTIEKFIQTIFN